MTAQQIIKHADALCPNFFTNEEKVQFLWQLDVLLKKQVEHLGVFPEPIKPYDVQSELLIENAYCDIYVMFLLCQFNFTNGDMDRYNASAVLFNTAYARYLDHLTEKKDGGERRSGDADMRTPN